MTLAVYIKEKPKLIKLRIRTPRTPKVYSKRDRFFFAFISLVGLVTIVFASWPFLVWQFKTLPALSSTVDAYPVPESKVLSVKDVLSSVQVVANEDGFSYFTTNYQPQGPRPKEFFITVPKLKIESAIVLVDSLKFDKNLSHFPGSAIPGEVGNTFITGHSVLPQFYDPKNYRAIFTKISELELGDDIIVDLNGKKFNYTIQYSKVVDRYNTSVLLPISQNGRNLTLMSCVPPGTNTKRIVVVASLL